jgi:hypothetical protein
MSAQRAKIYDLYLAAWSAVSDAERARMLRERLSEDIVFKNPLQTRHGLAEVTEHLEGSQLRSPGGSFRMNNMVGWGRYALAEWQLVDATVMPASPATTFSHSMNRASSQPFFCSATSRHKNSRGDVAIRCRWN